MKILYVITRANEIGGAQTHLRDMTISLVNDGHEVEVIVGEQGALVNVLKDIGVKVHIVKELVREISPIKDLKCIYIIRKIIKNYIPDIVALHSSKAGIVGRLAVFGLNVPTVFTAHGWSFANGVGKKRRNLYIIIEKLFTPLTDRIITVSTQDKLLALECKVAKDEKQVVIHNGIPLKDLPSHDYIHNGKVRIISVARFSEQKDHDSLLRALSLLEDRNWVLTLVGKGPRLDEIKQLSKKLKIDEQIIFAGERLDIDNLLANSDVFILISNWEGFPISILEAMREGLPVLASDVGGVSESVIDGDTGYLVARGDVNAIRDKLSLLLTNVFLRERLGKKGKSMFLNNFSFSAMYHKTLFLYESVIKEKNR